MHAVLLFAKGYNLIFATVPSKKKTLRRTIID